MSVKSDRRMITYANGDQAQYMDHLFLCEVAPGGNGEPVVGDDESMRVGWFALDDLPEPLSDSTRERIAYVQRYLRHRAEGSARAQFAFDGVIEHL